MRVVAIIVAAGRGLRVGSNLPKQYLLLNGKSLISHTIERFLNHPSIDRIQMVIDLDEIERYAVYSDHAKFLKPVAGGTTRQQSVFFGLSAAAPDEPSHVLIHDGARPLISDDLIDRLIQALQVYQAVLPVTKIADTLKQVDGNIVRGDQDRDRLVRAQTPQAFDFAMIHAAHNACDGLLFTDDAGIALHAGHKVHIIPGEESNYKVTEKSDIERAQRDLAGPRRWSTAQGYDVHRLVEGRRLMLCGIEIPHSHGLDGHSDADVALHALTDAILGLTGAGDIGSHFPPSDPQWKDASSDRFLRHAVDLLRGAGGELSSIDLTIIAEMPKIGPHRDAMRARLEELTGLQPERISIKATTNERLGFLGRAEGIAALGAATASLPA